MAEQWSGFSYIVTNLARFIRPDEITFPRNEDGTRTMLRKPAGENLPPVDLNTFISQHIEDGVGYLTAFYGIFFDSFTAFLRAMLGIITAVFVLSWRAKPRAYA